MHEGMTPSFAKIMQGLPTCPERGLLPLSVVVLTLNERSQLAGCLDSLAGVSDDVHVIDSGSTDGTLEFARSRGASTHTRPFTTFADQRNWAIDTIPHHYQWVFHLDADERFTPKLALEVSALLARDPDEAGFLVPSKLMLGSSWLKRSGEYPAYQCRLFHRERLRFVVAGHGQREVTSGAVGALVEPYLHYPFSRGLEHWFQKHARYARQEAEGICANESGVMRDFASLVRGPAIARRRSVKRLSYRLPARGTLRLLHLLIVKRGILDGRAGVLYARMKANYESMVGIQLKAIELGIEAGDLGRSAAVSSESTASR